MLKIKDLSVNYLNENQELVPVFSQLNLEIEKGEFVSILGPSGCGKSTLLKILAGTIKNYTGNIYINNDLVNNNLPQMGYMPQNDLLLPWKTVKDNLKVPFILQKKSLKKAIPQIVRSLREFDLLIHINKYPSQLSGGQKSRIALLKTLFIDAEFMLLDEPFGALDAITRGQMQKIMLEIYQKFNRTIIFVTHDIEEAILLSNRIYIFSARGTILTDLDVNLKNKNQPEIVLDPEFLKLKRQIINFL